MDSDRKTRFENAAKDREERLLTEYIRFLSRRKKYWLVPIIVMLLMIGLLVMLGGSSAGAFIYTLF